MGIFAPHATPITELGPGEVGFLAGNIKSVVDTKIGDTVTDAVHPATEQLPTQGSEADGVRGNIPPPTRRSTRISATRSPSST